MVRMGPLIQACFKAWKASKASSDSDTHSVFQWLSDPCKALYESLVMVHKAEKSTDLHKGLRWCALSNGH